MDRFRGRLTVDPSRDLAKLIPCATATGSNRNAVPTRALEAGYPRRWKNCPRRWSASPTRASSCGPMAGWKSCAGDFTGASIRRSTTPVLTNSKPACGRRVSRTPLRDPDVVVLRVGTGKRWAQAGTRVSRPGERLFWVAGIWEEKADLGPCYSMVTTAASPLMAPIHDRMPAVLRPEEMAEFLAGTGHWNFQPFTGPLVVTPCESPLTKRPPHSESQQELF